MLLRHAKYVLGSVVVLTALLLGASPVVYGEEPPVAPSIVAPVMPPQVNTIDMKAPTTKQRYGKLIVITTTGISEADKTVLIPHIQPNDGSLVWFWSIGNVMLIQAEPEYDTTYQITLGMNEWRKGMESVVSDMMAAKVPKELIDMQIAVNKKAEAEFPFRFGTCTLEVAGAKGPFDPAKPPPTPDSPTEPTIPPGKVTRVTYIWEKDQGPIPHEVAAALNKLNQESKGAIIATDFEDDARDGNGEIPLQYRAAMDCWNKHGGSPMLVVQSGNTVLRYMRAPTTMRQVLEAAK